MPSLVSSRPVGGKPANSPRPTWLSVYFVTTLSPSASCSSMVKLVVEKASLISAIVRLKSSRVGPCPGIRLRSTKSGLSSSSMTSRFPLASSSKKRRTIALFSSAPDDTAELPPHQANLHSPPRGLATTMMPPGGVWRIDRRLFTGVRGRKILRSSGANLLTGERSWSEHSQSEALCHQGGGAGGGEAQPDTQRLDEGRERHEEARRREQSQQQAFQQLHRRGCSL